MACDMHAAIRLSKTVLQTLPHMKILKAIIRLLVAGAFATAEAVLLVDELPIARLWHRKHS